MSLRDHEQNRLEQLGLPMWRRLLRYVRPYWGFVALAMTITLTASAADFFRVYLVMPLFDEVILPAGKNAASTHLDRWMDQLSIPFDLGESQSPDAEGQSPGAEGETTPEAPPLSEEAMAEQIRKRFVQIVIAHRLSTIRRADRIFVIEDGTITQRGTHNQLLNQEGLYRELVDLQSTAT